MNNHLVKNIFWNLSSQGVLLIIFGILIVMFKDLLNILVSAFLISSGLIAIIWAFRIKNIQNKY